MLREYLGIKIDDDYNKFFTDFALKTLEDRYMVGDEKSPQEAFARAAVAFSDDLDHAQRIYDYVAKQWFMFATPILSNGGTDRGLGISCFLSIVADSRRGLSNHYDENIWLASNGGGIGGYWGDIRSDGQHTSCGSKSSGSIPFLHVVDSQMMAFNQGSCYLPGHEILTDKGWIKFEDLTERYVENSDIKVYQVTPQRRIELVQPIRFVEQIYQGECFEFKYQGRSIVTVTGNHGMIVDSDLENSLSRVPASEVKYDETNFFPCSIGLSPTEQDVLTLQPQNLSHPKESETLWALSCLSCGLSPRYSLTGDLKVMSHEESRILGSKIEKISLPQEERVVYCVEVPSGMIIVRYNGFVSVCGNTRRGSYAAYQNISHPEIDEFVGMRKPTGGDIHRKCLNLHHGVNITDDFMQKIEKCMEDKNADDTWDLIDPHSKRIVRTVSIKELWARLLETRVATGEPYLHFIDRSNEFLPQSQKDLGLKVNTSNLCVEITEATDALRTAVCCLSSLNLTKWEEWKDHPHLIRDLVRFLDNVLEVFIWSIFSKEKKQDLLSLSYTYEVKVKNSGGSLSEQDQKEFLIWLGKLCNPGMDGLKKAAFSAFRERSIGLGAMGFHSLLQSKLIPFESPIALGLNRQIFKHIKEEALKETRLLAELRGEAPDMRGTGRRNAHLLALAPNASSSILCGEQYTSPSIEPFRAVAFTAKTLSGSFLQKNPYLQALLETKDLTSKKIESIWKSIIGHRGSCQHIEVLDEWEKMVFRTALEVDQNWVIEHAAMRQEFICQAQSLNLFFRPSDEISYLHGVHFLAWKKGLKTLYYCRSEALRAAENVETKVERKAIDTEGCISCEG